MERLIVIISIILMICCIIWIADINRFKVVQYEFKNAKIKKKYRFMIIADLHEKSYGKDNSRLFAAIKEWNPDGIIIAGDMITGETTDGYYVARKLMTELEKNWPVYYGHGNHEQRIQNNRKDYGKSYRKFRKAIAGKNLHMLINQRINLPEFQIDIAGIEIGRQYFKRFTQNEMSQDYIETLLKKPSENSFQILIAHNPEYFHQYQQWGADLTISGHIHGGIIRIPFCGGLISPSGRLFPKYDGGLFEKNGRKMIISRGLGMHTLPVRFLNPGELTAITLLPVEE